MTESDFVVDTHSGILRGRREAGVACFRAVPYAEPPVGELRFAPPRACRPWTGVRDATQPGPIAPQGPSRLRHVMGTFERSQAEDCLTLTVWTPAADAQRRPVVVWLHGGGFMSGAGDLPWYDGATLAREGDVVVVGVNYRLGVLGFLCADGIANGNFALMDQALAVAWVAQHIEAFGGDPAHVTLMGQSAGGLSIALLLSRSEPMEARRALLMSPPLGVLPLAPARAHPVGDAFVRALGADPADPASALARLRSAPLADVMAAQGQAARYFVEHLAQPDDVSPPFVPVGDGRFLAPPDQFPGALSRAAGRLDVLIGTTRDESTAFGPTPARTPMTTHIFETPAAEWATAAASAGRQAFLYRLDWAPPASKFGATHCLDLPLVFGTAAAFEGAPMLSGADPAEVRSLSARMRASWLAFIRDGTPGPALVAPWPPVNAEACHRLQFDVDTRLQALPA